MKISKFRTEANKPALRIENTTSAPMHSFTVVLDTNSKVFGVKRYGNYRIAVWMGPVWFGLLRL